MIYTHLLAKSCADWDNPPPEATLHGHTARVVACARRVLAHVGEKALLGAGLEPTAWRPRLELALLFAAAWHDAGKLNDAFQQMVRGQRNGRAQPVRHEALSGLLLLCVPKLRRAFFDPLLERDPLVAWACVAAACGHHVKFPPKGGFEQPATGDEEVRAPLLHESFQKTMEIVASVASVDAPVIEADVVAWKTSRFAKDNVFALLEDVHEEIDEGIERAIRSQKETGFVALVKGLLVGADVAGSALARAGEPTRWIDDSLGQTLTSKDANEVVRSRLKGVPLRPFQRSVAESVGTVTFVRAGCGSGKTVAAYAWAARQAAGRKLFFCYPTTGTATEGFRDYAADVDVPSALIHGRAEVDLKDLAVNGPDDEEPASVELSRLQKLDALRAWCPKVITCTVDTVLGALVLNRAGLFGFPAIATGAFVFDEIHSYDDRLFGLLLRFLELFPRVPMLLMTASLPQHRLLRLRAQRPDLIEIEGPPDLERLSRYRLSPIVDDVPWAEIERTLQAKGKVLCVSNTVDRCIQLATTARRRLAGHGVLVLAYHSRYRYEDRVARHKEVIEAFRAAGPVVACTTQVAEMSLDLSADLLVTDLAPIPALIQRLGRLHRRATPEQPGEPKLAVAIRFEGKPYNCEDLALGRSFWESLAARDRPLSQADLAEEFLAQSKDGPPVRPVRDQLLDGGATSQPDSAREPGYTVTVLLERDRERVERDPLEAMRCALPLSLPSRIARELGSWPRCRYLPVVPEGTVLYDKDLGARFSDHEEGQG